MATVSITMTTAAHAALVQSINDGALRDYRSSLENQLNHKDLSELLGHRFSPTAIAKFQRVERRMRGLDAASAAILSAT